MAAPIMFPSRTNSANAYDQFTGGRPFSSSAPPAKFEQEVVEWCESAQRQAEEQDAQTVTYKLMPKIIQYLGGQQWPSRPTAYGSSRPVTNRMFRQYWELVSLLTDGKPEPQIKIYDTENDYSDLQAEITQLLTKWSAKPGYADALQDIVGFGLMAHGIGKIQWNSRLTGGFGDVEMLSINPMNIHLLGGDGSMDEAEMILEERAVTIAAIRRKYGHLADLVEPDANMSIANQQTMKPSSLSSAEWSKLAPNMRRILGVKQGGQGEDLYPMAKLRQFWIWDPAENETSETIKNVGWSNKSKPKPNWCYDVEPGMPIYPRGRLVITAGKRVLDDTCNPYFHATFPYVDMTPLRTGWNKEGMSLMGNLIGPQDIVNRLTAGLLETIKASLIPTIITPRNSVSRSDLDNMSTTISGGKIEYNPNAAAPPSFRAAPQVPALALQFNQDVKSEMDQTTGSSAINDAAQRDQIPSHDSLELIQNSRSSMVRIMGRSLERFMSRAGGMVVANMLQFYTVGQRMAILGGNSMTRMDYNPLYKTLPAIKGGMAPEEFIKRTEFTIKPGSSLTFEKETKVQMAAVLRRNGDLSRNNLFRALDANIDMKQNEAELIVEAEQKAMFAAAASAAAGPKK